MIHKHQVYCLEHTMKMDSGNKWINLPVSLSPFVVVPTVIPPVWRATDRPSRSASCAELAGLLTRAGASMPARMGSLGTKNGTSACRVRLGARRAAAAPSVRPAGTTGPWTRRPNASPTGAITVTNVSINVGERDEVRDQGTFHDDGFVFDWWWVMMVLFWRQWPAICWTWSL